MIKKKTIKLKKDKINKSKINKSNKIKTIKQKLIKVAFEQLHGGDLEEVEPQATLFRAVVGAKETDRVLLYLGLIGR